MDSIDRLRAFVCAADLGSFARAGRILGRSRDNISKLVADLEIELGHALFVRSTRVVALSDAGEACLKRARPIVEAYDDLQTALRGAQVPLTGSLSVSAPASFGIVVLAPLIGAFIAANPGVAIHLVLDDQPRDRIGVGVDLAFRISERAPANAACERLGTVRRGVFAARAYLDAHGEPAEPAHLGSHRCLHYQHLGHGERWELFDGERCEHVEIRGSLSCNTGLALADAAAAGGGITILPWFSARRNVADGALVRILEPWAPAPLALFALLPGGGVPSRRLRSFLDFVSERMGATLDDQ